MSILDKLNELKIEVSKDLLPNDFDFKKLHESVLIDMEIVHDRPPLVISIGRDEKSYNGTNYPLRFGTSGNISMILGEEKVRKSFLKSLILGCCFGGRSNLYTNSLEILGHNLKDKYIFDVDTEQDEYDSWLNAIRIPKLVGQKPENYIPIRLREKTPSERLQYLEYLFLESEYKNNLALVSIDGFVDLVNDFNSQIESSELTQKLMKWSSIAKCHITGVLHLNPGTTKGRGHLGTILQQKCETVAIIADKGDYSLVTCQKGRGKKFKDFCITVNDEWLPEIIDNPEQNWM